MELVNKLICMLTRDGKKSKAERIVFAALHTIHKSVKSDPIDLYLNALENVKPLFEIKSAKVGGKTQQIPFYIKEERRLGLALRWIIEGVRLEKKASPKKKFHNLLALELENASLKKGFAYYKKKRLYRVAESNRGLIQKRWW